MSLPSIKNRVGMSVSGTPGTGTITLASAESGYQSFATAYGANANVDVLVIDGSAWEVARDCAYTHSGTTLSRGTFEASSTGSALSLTSAAKVYVVVSADRLSGQIARACLAVYAGGGSAQTFGSSWTSVKISSPFGNAAAIDTCSGWSVSNKRYTPTVPGKYLFIASSKTALNINELVGLSLYKNGAVASFLSLGHQARGSGTVTSSTPAGIIEMNGTTDYVELWAMVSSTSGASIASDTDTAILAIYLGP